MVVAETIKKDVIVVGGGMAGVSAAISAAEGGAEVLLLEQTSCLGGVATAGLVTPMMKNGVFTYDGKKVVAGNLDKIMDLSQFYEGMEFNFNPEIIKCVLDELLMSRGVQVLFHTFIYDVERQGEQIIGLIGANKSGVTRFKANVYIDATGDADVAYRAGSPTMFGRESDGLTQAVSLRFIAGNIDVPAARGYLTSVEGKETFMQAIKEYSERTGFEILDTKSFQNYPLINRPNELAFNCPRIVGIDGTKASDLSKAYLEGRKKILVYIKLLRENVPGCEHIQIISIAPLLGVRETRRLKGDYIVTEDDVVEGRKFDDGIGCNSWFIDIHNPKGSGIGYGSAQKTITYPKGGWNDIPYRALYSSAVTNLLVAGKCVSSTHEAHAAIRIMASCIAMGQAAGTAAAMAIQGDSNVCEVDVVALRNKLAEDGALITGVNL
ncbi:FAD-dependent oxidoreductase [Paenibacillus koleovorans]|uniref:FAD-dependent oxidoreductase n=1 Tax=Paenibacillus koleovorans TaxID=121608 RepID=UPI0013E28AC3|nr:FAD-dependent oxidoreductase [Paenibacillus koleovorans]